MYNTDMIKALNRIADGLQAQNKLLDDISVSLNGINEIVRDVAYYPADDKHHPRIVVGGSVDVFRID